MSEQLDIDTADIIDAIETELAANWYAHAAAERRAQRDANVDYSVPDDIPDWIDLTLVVALWLVLPGTLVLGMWVLYW